MFTLRSLIRLRLLQKLFLANLSIIVLLVLILVGVNYLSSRSLLNNFFADKEREWIKGLGHSLSLYYKQMGNWDEFYIDKTKWEKFAEDYLEKNIDLKALMPEGMQKNRNLAKKEDSALSSKSQPYSAGELNQSEKKHPVYAFIISRISLLDGDEQEIALRVSSNDVVFREPVLYEGKPVAWLELAGFEKPDNKLAQYYLAVQLKITIAVAIMGIILSAFVSYILSRHLTSPIKKIIWGADQLSKRNFTVTVANQSQDELGELAEHFNSMGEKFARYEQQQKQWLLDISHELRTPLTIIRGEIEAISDGVSECSVENIVSLKADIILLNRLIDDLHELSVTDNLDLSSLTEPVILGRLVELVVNRFRERFKLSCIETVIEIEPVMIEANAGRLEQVLINILENCVRYCTKPGKVWIKVHSENESVILLIQDTGPGVGEKDYEQLFDRLYRGNARLHRKQSGAGLGLAICRNIIEAHKGVISATKAEAGGLQIRIVLPKSQSLIIPNKE